MGLVPNWLTPTEDGDYLLTIWVVPGASRTEIVGEHGDALKVKVSAPPERGRANKALLKHISKLTGTKATLESGNTSRRKMIRVHGSSMDAIASSVLAGQKPEARGQKPDL
jgi:uncharacterized protein (TIGR00251 family)